MSHNRKRCKPDDSEDMNDIIPYKKRKIEDATLCAKTSKGTTSMAIIEKEWYKESDELNIRLRDNFCGMKGGKRTTPNIMEEHPKYKTHNNQENIIRTTMLDYFQIKVTQNERNKLDKDESLGISMNVADKGKLLEHLEKGMADIIGMKQVWLTTSGALANMSLLQAILRKELNVYYDQCMHMTVQCMLIQNKNIYLHKFQHNNIDELEDKITKNGSGLIITEGAFSHNGSIPDLKRICDIKQKFDCKLLIDESHSIGLYGTKGGGIMRERGLIKHVDFMTASLSKAWSCPALAIIAINDEKLTNWFEMNSLHCFSSAAPRCLLNRLENVMKFYKSKELKEKQCKMRELIQYTQHCIKENDLDKLIKMDHPILTFPQYPILCHEKQIYEIQGYLMQKCDIFAPIFCSPAWTKPYGIIRIALNVDMERKRVKQIIETIKECREKFNWE
eukprot:230105_1